MKDALVWLATAFARIVLPVPGGHIAIHHEEDLCQSSDITHGGSKVTLQLLEFLAFECHILQYPGRVTRNKSIKKKWSQYKQSSKEWTINWTGDKWIKCTTYAHVKTL